jgi:hypothetical protein
VEDGKTAVITRHERPIGGIMPPTEATQAQLDRWRQARLIAWSEHNLEPLAPVDRVRGAGTVEDRPPEKRESRTRVTLRTSFQRPSLETRRSRSARKPSSWQSPERHEMGS